MCPAALHARTAQGKGQFYDLETLLFFARHINSKFTEYFKKANKEIGKAVTFVDRRVRSAPAAAEACCRIGARACLQLRNSCCASLNTCL